MLRMRKRFLIPLLSSVVAGVCCLPAMANWEHYNGYSGSWYDDDGARFIISVRGGMAWGNSKIQNDAGALTTSYYYDQTHNILVSSVYYATCDQYPDKCPGFVASDYEYAGYAALGDLDAPENFNRVSFAAGASLGWTIPNSPRWRMELGWDHISEAEYNTSPLFSGNLALQGGDISGIEIDQESGAVQSKVTSDIFSAMVFYDFFDGMVKPLNKVIPYIGFGLGYVDSATELELADIYGDLSEVRDLGIYAENDDGVYKFYKSTDNSNSIAGIGSLGISYGITDKVYLDAGIRVMYIPKIRWTLSNADGSKHRDWFSAKNMIYTNAMVGIRFEF